MVLDVEYTQGLNPKILRLSYLLRESVQVIATALAPK